MSVEKTVVLADMHTHSNHSHDSECRMEDMCLSEIEKGVDIMAVTDHLDICLRKTKDVSTPIIESYNEVQILKEKYKDKLTLLAGVEVGEGFWVPEIYKELMRKCDFDVVIGSIHCVSGMGLDGIYSMTDFSDMPTGRITDLLYKYFDDLTVTAETTDYDILAHLTCPVRYINGKYKRDISLKEFRPAIENILKAVIGRDKTLEVNASSFLTYDLMPNAEILSMYRELGGRYVSLASDAHVAENAAQNFNDAIKAVKEIGLKTCFYKQRERFELDI